LIIGVGNTRGAINYFIMITTKTHQEIKTLREGGKLLSRILKQLAQAAKPGVSGDMLDKMAYDLITQAGAKPAFLNYQANFMDIPFTHSLCVSKNEVIVHGVPTKDLILAVGDLVSLDLGLIYKNLFVDSAISIGIGKISDKKKKLLTVTKRALLEGIKAAIAGHTLGDVGYAIQSCAEKNGLVVIKNLVGHGVGYELHESPEVFNFGRPHKGIVLNKGNVLALEPMLTYESGEIIENPDGSFSTLNGEPACHFEHSIAVMPQKSLILTL